MALLLHLTQKLAQGFNALWARYPNHNAKKDAEKAYGQVVTTAEIDAQVHKALDWQIEYWQSLDWYHPPYLATYLRKGRYLDEQPAAPKPKPPQASPATVTRFTQMGLNEQPRKPLSEAQQAARAQMEADWTGETP